MGCACCACIFGMGNRLFRAVQPAAAAARTPIRNAELPQHAKQPPQAIQEPVRPPEPAGAVRRILEVCRSKCSESRCQLPIYGVSY